MSVDDAAEQLGADVSSLGLAMNEEQLRQLARFEDLLLSRGIPLGLIGEGDSARLRTRHVLDSLRAAVAVLPTDRTAYDLGSGAGLPGIPVAIARPGLSVAMVESRRKRAAFLELVVGELGLANASVAASRVEELEEPRDLCFARAIAGLTRLWAMARPLLGPRGRLVYFAGKSAIPEGPLPGGASTLVLRHAVLESNGPLVIMARQ
ncbi:MAG: 16S rRNA (guanine(527)-N(7))-methyltransferase RsmG [Actinomycetota bacterium]